MLIVQLYSFYNKSIFPFYNCTSCSQFMSEFFHCKYLFHRDQPPLHGRWSHFIPRACDGFCFAVNNILILFLNYVVCKISEIKSFKMVHFYCGIWCWKPNQPLQQLMLLQSVKIKYAGADSLFILFFSEFNCSIWL